MDKNINTFCMRLREWFSWHFPELSRIVADNHIYTKVVQLVGTRENLSDDMKEQIGEILNDEEKAQQILDASRSSMGQEMSEADAIQVKKFTERVVELITFRESL